MDPKWICVLIGMAAGMGIGVLFHHPDASSAANVISLAQSIVTGAFGIAVGHSVASKEKLSDLPPGSVVSSTESAQTPPITTTDSTNPTTGA